LDHSRPPATRGWTPQKSTAGQAKPRLCTIEGRMDFTFFASVGELNLGCRFAIAGQTGWIEYPLASSATPFNRYFIRH